MGEPEVLLGLAVSEWIPAYFWSSWQVLRSLTLRMEESPLDDYMLLSGRSRKATFTLSPEPEGS
jgi:hypothetical protein